MFVAVGDRYVWQMFEIKLKASHEIKCATSVLKWVMQLQFKFWWGGLICVESLRASVLCSKFITVLVPLRYLVSRSR